MEPESDLIRPRKPERVGSLLAHPVWRVFAERAGAPGISEFEFVPGIGASTSALRARVRGRAIAVFPERDPAELEAGLRSDPNFAFKKLNTPLFPNTNRLLPDRRHASHALGRKFKARVAGIPVRMPFNHRGSQPGAIPHQLHGLLFKAPARETVFPNEPSGGAFASTTFEDFFGGDWVGSARVTIEQSIEEGAFVYRMIAQNTGGVGMPVGFGTHPYFQMPGGDPARIELVIPSTRYAEIDNYDNVLPTGRLLPVRGSAYNFNRGAGTRIDRLFDNYFLLDTPERSVELIDHGAGVVYRMTALTDNVRGVQIFYPGQGDVIAIEMVTHHPDPREALWGREPTGMQVLAPGESAQYAYRIEVYPL